MRRKKIERVDKREIESGQDLQKKEMEREWVEIGRGIYSREKEREIEKERKKSRLRNLERVTIDIESTYRGGEMDKERGRDEGHINNGRKKRNT